MTEQDADFKPEDATMTERQFEQFVGMVQQELQLNAQDTLTVRQRMASTISGGYSFDDTLHNVYLDFGYPSQVTFYDLWNMYRRLGIAKSVVELPVDMTWLTEPMIESSDASFMRGIEELIVRFKLWKRTKGLDTRQRVGRYAGMFMRVRDGKTPDQPLENLNGVGSIVNMQPMYEGQLEVQTTDNDETSPRFGMPEMYFYNSGNVGNRNEKSKVGFNIHWSRVVIAAEGADDGGIYGIPALEGCYNSLMDIRKLIGAGGEGFYRNAAHRLFFSLQDVSKMSTDVAGKLSKFNDQFDDFMHNMNRRAIWAPGLDAKQLQSDLISNEPHFNTCLADVSADSGIPSTILIGKQTGRLASAEDSRHFLSIVQSRRHNYGTEMIRDIIDWFIEYAVLPMADYEVEWDDLLARSDEEKLANAEKMTMANERSFKSGSGPIFSDEEIREAAGFDPMELPEPEGEEIDELNEFEGDEPEDDDGSQD